MAAALGREVLPVAVGGCRRIGRSAPTGRSTDRSADRSTARAMPVGHTLTMARSAHSAAALGSRLRRRLPLAGTALVLGLGLGAAACGDDAPDAAGPVDGAEVYEARCASCHGGDLGGSPLGPSLRSELYGPDRFEDDRIRASISQGAEQVNWEFGPMPMVSGLSAAEVDAVIALIREVQAAEGLEPFPPG
jgi:mono/diheme cytochrome c family protein